MKNCILMICIVACTSIFFSCSTDDAYADNANKYQTTSGTAELRPVLPTDPIIQTGTITGSFYPVVPAKAIAINSKGINYEGIVWESGEFKIPDVPIGTYSVCIIPKDPSPYHTITVPNVLVRADQTTDLGSLSFYVEQ